MHMFVYVNFFMQWDCTKLGRIVGNLVQLWDLFTPDKGLGGTECTPIGP